MLIENSFDALLKVRLLIMVLPVDELVEVNFAVSIFIMLANPVLDRGQLDTVGDVTVFQDRVSHDFGCVNLAIAVCIHQLKFCLSLGELKCLNIFCGWALFYLGLGCIFKERCIDRAKSDNGICDSLVHIILIV